jgi:hypothetical protein
MNQPDMTRAERRRIQRELGYRRAPGKKGRRPGHRALNTPATERFEALEQAGVVIARPRIVVPSEQTARP